MKRCGPIDEIGPVRRILKTQLSRWRAGTLGGIVDHQVLPARDVGPKPAEMPWTEAGGLSASGQMP
jgi:hypothetical protein